MSKRVGIYCRVSTIEQAEEGYSIDEQKIKIQEYCEKMVIKCTKYMRIEV